VVIRFSLPDLFDFNEFISAKTCAFPLDASRLSNVAALDAVSVPTVASCHLTPTGETLYSCYSLRASNIPARPAKHTRQTYIHEALPIQLYQTRYGVICFAPFQHPDQRPLLLYVACYRPDDTVMHDCAETRHAVLNTLTPVLTSRRREPGGRSLRYGRREFRQPLR
jgi:hypothetical protein